MGINQVKTGTIIRESFEFLNRDAIKFFQFFLMFFLPAAIIRLLFLAGGRQLELLWLQPSIYFIFSHILVVPFKIAVVRFFINRIHEDQDIGKINSRVILIYLSAAGLLSALGAIDYFLSKAFFQYPIAVWIISGVLSMFSLAVNYISYLLLPVAFLEKTVLLDSWKCSLKYVVLRWETSLIIMILFGILIRAGYFFLTVASSSSQMFNSTADGERLSLIGLVVYFLMSFLLAYLISVSLYGRTRYYLDIKQQERQIVTQPSM